MLNEPVVLLLIAAVIITFAGILWSGNKPRHGNRKAKALTRLRNSGKYWGVTIRNGNCSASKRLCGRGYRLAEAPALPVPGCRSLRCACTYTGLRERRKKQRRRNPDRRSTLRLGSEQPERRRQRDRRSSFHS